MTSLPISDFRSCSFRHRTGSNSAVVIQCDIQPARLPTVSLELQPLRIVAPGVPWALIVWLARAVKVVRPWRPCDSTLTALASPRGPALSKARLECMSGQEILAMINAKIRYTLG